MHMSGRPGRLKESHPGAIIKKLKRRAGFPAEYNTFFLDPNDPFFSEVQKLYLEEQTRPLATSCFSARGSPMPKHSARMPPSASTTNTTQGIYSPPSRREWNWTLSTKVYADRPTG